MNLVYQNPLEESFVTLTDFYGIDSHRLLGQSDLYKIIWVMALEQKMTIDGYELHLNKGDVVFCTPLNFVDLPSNQKELEGVVFNREFYCVRDNDEEVSCNGFLFYGSSRPVIINLDEKNRQDFVMIFDIFKEEFQHKDFSEGEMLRAMLKRLLIKSTRLARKGMQEPNLYQEKVDVIRSFNILVEKHFKTLHQVTDYADLLCKSPKTLANLFKKYNHKTPLTSINERILLEARRLLLFSEMTAEEIAYELGYNEASHFSKFFKKHKGCSPIEFKKTTLLVKKGNNLQL